MLSHADSLVHASESLVSMWALKKAKQTRFHMIGTLNRRAYSSQRWACSTESGADDSITRLLTGTAPRHTATPNMT